MWLSHLDRRAGALIRRLAGARPGGAAGARLAAGALGPSFRALVALLVLRPRSRPAGLDALAAAVLASGAARLVRDRLGRPRPGPRAEGGLPSRHAAAAVAIAVAVGRHDRAAGRALRRAALVGLTARVASGDHDPADIACGAALGWGAAHIVGRGWCRGGREWKGRAVPGYRSRRDADLH